MTDASHYAGLLAEIKNRIQAAQTRAVLAVNSELIGLYWQIGALLEARQASEGWGAAVIPRLARDIRNELPEQKGFSERNLKRMLAFHREYPRVVWSSDEIVPQPVAPAATDTKTQAEVPQPVAQTEAGLLAAVPWGHHLLLMERVKDRAVRRWYMAQTLTNGLSRSVLAFQIDN